MSMFAWKRVLNGTIIQSRTCATIEELFAGSSFKLPVRDVSSVGYVVATVIKGPDGKWIEDNEKDRIWRAIVAASST